MLAASHNTFVKTSKPLDNKRSVVISNAFTRSLKFTNIKRRGSFVRASAEQGCNPVKNAVSAPLTGLVFEESAVQNELATVDKTNAQTESLARVNFHSECEAAINEQVNTEYNVSYVYHALYAYFDRDNVALPGLAAFFKHSSEEEREHAELLMEYQNLRGGRVALKPILPPDLDLSNEEKGDALQAMEIALSLEKLNFAKLRQLHEVASRHGDAQMEDFIEGKLLQEQVESVKKIAEYVSQLRRVGRGLGVYVFDRELARSQSKGPK